MDYIESERQIFQIMLLSGAALAFAGLIWRTIWQGFKGRILRWFGAGGHKRDPWGLE